MNRATRLAAHQNDWEELAELDPLWAIMSQKEKRLGKWDPLEFFETGRREVEELMGQVSALLSGRERVLDFGCGVGRLTKALSAHFGEAHGVDISGSMIRKAREFGPECKFWLNPKNNLALFPDGHFDLVYSNIVLQHQPSRALIRDYIAEFFRVLKPGGVAVFMVPRRKSIRNFLNIKRTAFHVLRRLGFSPAFLYRKGLHTMRMTGIPVKDVERVIAINAATLLSVGPSSAAHYGMLYVARKM